MHTSICLQTTFLKSTEAYAKEDESAPRCNPSQRGALVSTEGYCKELKGESFAVQARALKAKFTSFLCLLVSDVQTTSMQ